jgi:hypothetical protein
MKKGVLTHIALMVVAIVVGFYLASYLTKQQEEIVPEKKNISKAPIAGMHKFAADVKWMFFINYLGSLKSVDGDNSKEVSKRIEEIISYDPNFESIYKDGALSLSVEAPEKTVEILKKACDNDYLKNNWQIPFYVGFIIMHHEKKPDFNEAAKYFLMAIQRSTDRQDYLANNYFRAKAASLGGKDDKLVMLQVLYDEWKKQAVANKEMAGEPGQIVSRESRDGLSASVIPDLTERLLKAAQEIKNSEKPTKEMLALVDEIRAKVLVGQHLCSKCLTPYAAGEKFCSKCGTQVPVYGVCSKCGAILKGDYCGSCGTKNQK